MSERWVLVPEEATEEMRMAGHAETPYCILDAAACRELIGDMTCHEAVNAVFKAAVAARPPIPDAWLEAAVERGALKVAYELGYVWGSGGLDYEAFLRATRAAILAALEEQP